MLSPSFVILSPRQRSNTSCVHMLVTQLPFWYMGHVWISIVSRITDIHFEQDNCLGAKQPSLITMALGFKAVLVFTVFHFGCVLMEPPNSCRIYILPHHLSSAPYIVKDRAPAHHLEGCLISRHFSSAKQCYLSSHQRQKSCSAPAWHLVCWPDLLFPYPQMKLSQFWAWLNALSNSFLGLRMSDDAVTRLHVGGSTCLTHAGSSFGHCRWVWPLQLELYVQ